MPQVNSRSFWQITVLHCFNPPSNDKLYAVFIENVGGPSPFVVKAGGGKRTQAKLNIYAKGQHSSISSARMEMDRLVRAKEAEYTDVESTSYSVPASVRVDVESVVAQLPPPLLIEGYWQNGSALIQQPQSPTKPKASKVPPIPKQSGCARVRRTIS
jgi:hypothetical protein